MFSRRDSVPGLFRIFVALSAALAFYFLQASAQEAVKPDAYSSVDPVSIKAYSSLLDIPSGGEFEVAMHVIIDSGWHINSHDPLQDMLIPTEVSVGESPFYIDRIVYPKGEMLKHFHASDNKS